MPLNDAFKALSDPSRRKILQLLAEGDMTAGEIAACFSMTKPSVSHHLNTLKAAGLIADERRGQNIIQELVKWFLDLGYYDRGSDSDEGE